MSFYSALILVLFIGQFLLDTLADGLSLKSFKAELPSEFVGVYDPAKYVKAKEYQSANFNFGVFHGVVSLAAVLSFIFFGGFNWVDQLARSFGKGPIVTGLIFVAILSALRMALQLPFSIYSTFVIEEKFGFNKTTPLTFVTDLLKGLALGMILGAPVMAGIIYFFEKFGSEAWLYSWLAISAFSLLLTFFAPAFVMPLFNKFTPVPEGELKQAIESYVKTQDFTLSGIYTMDSSKRSTKANAFFAGFGKFRRLVFFDTLLEKHTIPELMAILAHEIGHFKRKHIPKFVVLSIASTGVMFFVLSRFINNPELFEAFRMESVSTYASILFVLMLYAPIGRVFSIFTHGLSRKFEFEADEFSVETYGSPQLLSSALKKLSVENLAHLTPHPLKVMLDYTHPPILQRIEALKHLEKQVTNR